MSLGVVRDADCDPNAAFQSVCSALQGAQLPEPSQPEIFEGNRPQVGILVLPDAKTAGMLEALCLKSVVGDPAMSCIQEYFNCVEQQLGSSPKNVNKARVQAFLASRPEHVAHLGLGALKGYWSWKDTAFDHVKQFLRTL